MKTTLRAQRGAILVITLVILAAMTLASVGVMRSVDTSVLLSGNLGFKRDAAARANVAAQQILTKLRNTTFLQASDDYCYTAAKCTGGNTENYSPVMLLSGADGVPTILTPANTTAFTTIYKGTLTASQASKMSAVGVTVYFLIERMCDTVGSPLESSCAYDDGPTQLTNSAGDYRGGAKELLGGGKAGTTAMPLFRLTVRADGPRNTVAYTQSMTAIQ